MFLEVLINGILLGTLYCIIAVGFSFTYNVTRFFDISQGVTFLIGGYLGYQAVNLFGIGLVPSFLFAMLGSGFFGAIVYVTLIANLRKREATPLAMFLATLGLLIVAQNALSVIYGSDTKVYMSGASIGITFGEISISWVQLSIATFTIVLIFFILFMVKYTAFGRKIRAISDSPLLATVVGLPVHKIILKVFVIASFISGAGGFFFGLDRTISPNSGLYAILIAMIAAVIGGVGNISGAIAGALTMGIVGTFAQYYLPGEWKYTTIFVIFISLISLRKKGIIGIEYRSI
jgi:branched-chain amino acid transport system permease protein